MLSYISHTIKYFAELLVEWYYDKDNLSFVFERVQKDAVPWKAIFTSLPVWALIVCNFARSFVFYMMLTNQPTYLNVFQFSMAKVSQP